MTTTHVFYGCIDANGKHCAVHFTDTELSEHPQLATDAAYRAEYPKTLGLTAK